MKHTYKVTGMTCSSCEAKVKTALYKVPEIESVEVSVEKGEATLTMSQHVALKDLQKVLDDKYTISAMGDAMEMESSWWATYKPVLLIFIYLSALTALTELTAETVDIFRWMRHFMAGFFLTFSFFKLLNIKGFADSYSMYDLVAKRFRGWGYIYPFVEVALGVANLLNMNPLYTNAITFVVMSVSIVGVLQSVLSKRTIQCACLGDVFNLPMSTVTIIEDGLMIAMSVAMLIFALG